MLLIFLCEIHWKQIFEQDRSILNLFVKFNQKVIFGPLLAMFGVVLVGYGSTSFSPQVELSTSHLSKNFLSTSPDCGECGKCSPGLCRAQGLWSDGQLTRGHAGSRSSLMYPHFFVAGSSYFWHSGNCLLPCAVVQCTIVQVLEEKNALLGPGLATNYWFSYLKWICTGGCYSILVENTRTKEDPLF